MRLWIIPLMTLSAQAADLQIFPGSAAVEGQVRASKECSQAGEYQLFVSRKSTLLYQAPATPNGTFEFHLMPGRYEIVAVSSHGCSDLKQFSLYKDKSTHIRLKLDKARRQPAAGLGGGFCPHCGPGFSGGAYFGPPGGMTLGPPPMGVTVWSAFDALVGTLRHVLVQ